MDPAAAQAEVIVDELVRSDIRQVVLCPGERGTALTRALYRAAADGLLELHVRLDERSAGFMALGVAQGAGRPVPVVCVSGTAAANLYPAVLQAHHARIGLLLLTADRPPEARHTGTGVGIAQLGMFGAATRAIEFPIAERRDGQNPIWRDLVCRAVAWASTGLPIQVNIPVREPVTLVPDHSWSDSLAGRPDGRPWTTSPKRELVIGSYTKVDLPAKTLVVMGSSDPQRIRAVGEVAAEAGWPVIADPGAVTAALQSGARVLSRGGLLVADGEVSSGAGRLPSALRPDAVLMVGSPTFALDVGATIGNVAVLGVDAYPDWADPAHLVHQVEESLDLENVRHAMDPESKWLTLWQQADRVIGAALDESLAAEPSLSGLQVAHDVMAQVPVRAMVFVGSSDEIGRRHLAVAEPRDDITVLAGRRVAGINGDVSTAVGLALALDKPHGPNVPCYALVDRLTFLRDTGGLLFGPEERRPNLTLVVVDEAGGGDFGWDLGAPPDIALAGLCAAYGVHHTVVHDSAWLHEELRVRPAGLRVIEVRADRARLHAQQERLHKAVAAATADIRDLMSA